MTPAELKQARELLRLSRSELAEVLGIHYNIVGRWERGDAKIPPYLDWAILGYKCYRAGIMASQFTPPDRQPLGRAAAPDRE